MPAVDASLDREILTGDFGLITSTARAGAVVTGAMNIDAYTWVEIATKGTASVFGDIPVGGIYYTPIMIPGVVGDSWYVLTENILGFARGWNIELTRNSLDTTALKDVQSTSVFGRPTTGGSINGFLVTNDTEADEAIRRFMTTYKIDLAGAVTSIEKSSDPLTFIGYTLKRASNKAFLEAYYLPEMDIGTLNVGSEVGGLSDFNTPLGLRSGEITRYVINLS